MNSSFFINRFYPLTPPKAASRLSSKILTPSIFNLLLDYRLSSTDWRIICSSPCPVVLPYRARSFKQVFPSASIRTELFLELNLRIN